MLHTIVPIDVVLESREQAEEACAVQPVRAQYMGEEVMLTKNNAGEYSIQRLLSTNPASYLKNGLSPGSRAEFEQVKLY